MLNKLNLLYDKEEALLKAYKKVLIEYEQVQEDKEMLQTMIMYASNRLDRKQKVRRLI